MWPPITENTRWWGSPQGLGFRVLRQDDVDLHHFVVFLFAELDVDGVEIDLDVFRDDLEQFILHGRDVVRPSGIRRTLMRDQNRQPVLGNGSRFLSFAEETSKK